MKLCYIACFALVTILCQSLSIIAGYITCKCHYQCLPLCQSSLCTKLAIFNTYVCLSVNHYWVHRLQLSLPMFASLSVMIGYITCNSQYLCLPSCQSLLGTSPHIVTAYISQSVNHYLVHPCNDHYLCLLLYQS